MRCTLVKTMGFLVISMFLSTTVGGGQDGTNTSLDCEAHCACMEQTCSMVKGYPYEEKNTCVMLCEAFTAEQAACWPKWCEKAKTVTDKTPVHLCEHAWGKLGLKECSKLLE